MFRHPAGTKWTPADTHAVQVWGPQDAIVTAQDFHADIEHAEHGTNVDPWWISHARPRRARIWIRDAAAAAALLITAAAIGIAVALLTAGQPHNQPQDHRPATTREVPVGFAGGAR
jgi:hypothetical protein